MKAASALPPSSPLPQPPLSIEQLCERARLYPTESLEGRALFDEQSYVRRILLWTPDLEIVLLCWSAGQSSSIHDHRGSNCVTRVLTGRFRERLYQEDETSGVYLETVSRMMEAGQISGLSGHQAHQVSNVLARGRGTLLNLYSPALSPAPRPGTGRHLAVTRP
jgi:cysteine dioxygenase